MRIVKVCLAAILAIGVFANVVVLRAEDKKPKHTIKEVMKLAMKGGLQKKVASGKASDEEKKELEGLYEDLAQNDPPKGSADSWKDKTELLVKAAKEVVEGKAGAGKALQKAADCMACHKAHKP